MGRSALKRERIFHMGNSAFSYVLAVNPSGYEEDK